MFASVRIGLSCAAAYDKVLFLPGDMPKPDAWSGYAYLTNHIRHAGDCVAMVAAESRELVDDALDAIEVEVPTNTGPYGARGLGEPTACAVAPAIVNAIADATGCYVRSLPADLEKVLKAARSGIENCG